MTTINFQDRTNTLYVKDEPRPFRQAKFCRNGQEPFCNIALYIREYL